MGISKGAVLAIKGLDKESKRRIAAGMNTSLTTLYRWLRDFDDQLTMAKSLDVIAKETGLPITAILEESEKAIA